MTPTEGRRRVASCEALREVHVGAGDAGLLGHHAPLLLSNTRNTALALALLTGEVVEAADPADQVHPGVHVLLSLSC